MLSVPIAVVSKRPDDAEAINQTLRNAGCIANCIHISDSKEIAIILKKYRPVLMFIFENDVESDHFKHIVQNKNQHLADLPILVVQARVNEENMAAAMAAGADDLVSIGNKARLQAVASREIKHCHLARQLHDSVESAQQLEEQLESLVKESPDALMHVQEGIIIGVNPAWKQLLGYDENDDMVGTPALDVFDEKSHTAFKGALVACAQGEWSNLTLEVKANKKDESAVAVKINLERGVFDDEPCILIAVEIDEARDQNTPQRIVSDSEHHPLTGFYRRQRFLSEMEDRLKQPSQGGVWVLAYIKPDQIHKIREQIGPISSDDLLLDFARVLQDHVRKTDLYGQFGGDLFMVLMPRGTLRDAEAWGENLRADLNKKIFEIAEKTLSVTCTIGLACHQSATMDIADLVVSAQKAYQSGQKKGGNQLCINQSTREAQNQNADDSMYVKKIQLALRQNNFRLAYQPVASLDNENRLLFDALLRMVDDDNRELMPNVFLPAARRNGLMKNIDRWVIATAIKFCKQQSPGLLFVRLSYDSIPDPTLVDWIDQQLQAASLDPSNLIFQVTESDAENHLKQVKETAIQLKKLNCGFAIEHFGVGSQSLQVIEHIPADFVKIDGSLMEGIATDLKLQDKVRTFVEAARARNIATVAERVEDANTMAVLWQIGFQYIQGFYVQGPEEIILESPQTRTVVPLTLAE